MTLSDPVNLDLQTNVSKVEDFFKNLNWIGVGIGALGVMTVIYYLITLKGKR